MPDGFVDFAWRTRRTLGAIVRNRFWAVAASGTVIVLALNGARAHQLSVAKDAQWVLSGAACPIADRAMTPPQSRGKFQDIEFGGNHYRRRFGHVSCTYVETALHPVPVCQFTAPGELSVVTGKKTFNFAPGIGRKATLSVRDGVAQCVLAGKFSG